MSLADVKHDCRASGGFSLDWHKGFESCEAQVLRGTGFYCEWSRVSVLRGTGFGFVQSLLHRILCLYLSCMMSRNLGHDKLWQQFAGVSGLQRGNVGVFPTQLDWHRLHYVLECNSIVLRCDMLCSSRSTSRCVTLRVSSALSSLSLLLYATGHI